MTDLTKLAARLDTIGASATALSPDSRMEIINAARILRSAAAGDVQNLIDNYGLAVAKGDRDATIKYRAALESALRLALAAREGFVMVPVERLTVEEIKTLRQQVRNDPRCQDEHWFVLMARAIEDRYLAAALTDQSQKKESP